MSSGKKLIWLLLIGLASASLLIALVVVFPSKSEQPVHSPPLVGSAENHPVACLGHIEPEDRVIRLGARSLTGQPSIIGKLLIKEGDSVKANQILAVLDSKDQLEAVWRQAEAGVDVARKRFDQVKAGAKAADIAAQQAEIARLEAELGNAQTEHRRYEELHHRQVVPSSALDSKRLLVNTLTQMINQAKQRLNSLSEVRQVDIDLAQAQVEASLADARRTRAEFDATFIRSPISGRVIKIHAWPGEEVGGEGIMELAKTDRMYVIAEVVETDLGRIRTGQRATITGDGLPRKMQGTVEQIGLKVSKNAVLPTDPATFSDARVVEVKIRLEDSESVAGLIHLRVNVLIVP